MQHQYRASRGLLRKTDLKAKVSPSAASLHGLELNMSSDDADFNYHIVATVIDLAVRNGKVKPTSTPKRRRHLGYETMLKDFLPS